MATQPIHASAAVSSTANARQNHSLRAGWALEARTAFASPASSASRRSRSCNMRLMRLTRASICGAGRARAAPPPGARVCRRRVVDRDAHVTQVGLASALAEDQQQRLVSKDVHQPGNATARGMQFFKGAVGKEPLAGVTGNRQPVRDVVGDFLAIERLQRVLESDALA